MILAQVLMLAIWILNGNIYPVYDVQSEEDVITLHNALSTSSHRMRVEIATACMWLSFPLLLMALYAIHGMLAKLVQGSNGEMFVYLMEKAFLIWIGIAYIILPALALVSVSYDWEFFEYTVDDKQVPTGYYIQLYTILLQLELIDSVSIADATFLISLFLAARFMLYGNDQENLKFKEFFETIQSGLCCPGTFMLIYEILNSCCLITLFVIFCVVLFEFAESGFFSPAGYAKFLIIYVVFLKFVLGIRMVIVSFSQKYDRIKEVFDRYDKQQQLLRSEQSAARASLPPTHSAPTAQTEDVQDTAAQIR
mmetsp:Transcript_41050/g.66034  ORF Transcript_41050/g.66034 Transcript_41050/m.66034 type:complete len:309 (-) Transcript_41050:327-1253(-)|eukprot:CAMPEP_0197049624 /NCGR_PEP_ID=MMETSP1384-20130603/24726_1 /TAXON_ID=29189 /ORGANISM="Ammonia sp." /LENGTH=308 /DNA_ID=CAMNT_0042481927 /DNA_START=1 /DNA_END=927 /DNA_ORIENTATION=-